MNYGDGWYGGVYVAAMYALSFVSDDIGFVVERSLENHPGREPQFHKCITDVHPPGTSSIPATGNARGSNARRNGVRISAAPTGYSCRSTSTP